MAETVRAGSIAHVFGLDDPLHIYTKMVVELWRFQDASSAGTKNEPFPEPLFIAYNLAITIWHMTDWLWMSSLAARQKLAKRYSINYNETPSGIDKGLERFQGAIAANCRALYICREIANASKHMRRKKSDPDIKAVVEWHPVISPAGHAHEGDLMMHVSISDKGQKKDADYFFIEALGYWERLLQEEKLLSPDAKLPQKIIKGGAKVAEASKA